MTGTVPCLGAGSDGVAALAEIVLVGALAWGAFTPLPLLQPPQANSSGVDQASAITRIINFMESPYASLECNANATV